MKWNSLNVLLCMLLMVTACQKKHGQSSEDESPVESEPVPISGTNIRIFNIRNGSIQCEPQERKANLICRATVKTESGELPATQIQTGTNLTWRSPEFVSGSSILSANCTVSEDFLSQSCVVELEGSSTNVDSNVSVSLNVKDTVTGENVVISKLATLPNKTWFVFVLSDGVTSYEARRYQIYKVTKLTGQTPTTEWVAGTGDPGFSGDGGPALEATFNDIKSLAFDLDGNLYLADWGNHRIRKIDSEGIVSTVAGTGIQGYPSDNVLALEANLSFPKSLLYRSASNALEFQNNKGPKNVLYIDTAILRVEK